MSVRVVEAGDVEGLVEMFGQLGYPVTVEALAARIRRNTAPGYRAWVYTDADGRPVGFAGGHVMWPWERDEPVAQLMILIADERFRGRGAGSALVEAFEAWARGEGARQLMLGSGAARAEAHRFYERRGYVATGVRFVKEVA
ncbi:GNAT family N-acetyltransferase [Phytomonospora endophytica]|uniref:GNAT superfamily N-acetyltransferase n=1 Tax=Phytomonospora endophytica TaxID=714109 RepID=A0A841FT46_9ACTN|nr:GNAT family N-acetyltransferase [Phytomonospora endophytica]MBB6035150.1 GNAT superfamily N-acetyltransferase [Phytomonospora endophytica]GIG64101.1 hypothetical protein Pen01_03960 [Phytomonospora endophytica]